MISTYSGYVTATKDMTATLSRVAKQATVKRDQAYYDENIGKVTTVDEFMSDYKLYSYAMKAYGLEDMTYAKAFMKKVLESDLSDTSSFANKLTDTRYKTFAAAFNFGTSSSNTAQNATQETNTLDLYEQSFTDEADSASTESSYYNAKIDKITNVSDILGNDRLKDYILKAYGVDPTYVSNSYLKSVLTSDVSDPDSFVNQNGNAAYKEMAAQFGFNSDGTLSGTTAQTSAQKQNVVDEYNNTVPSYTTSVAAKANDTYYKAEIGSITSVTELTSDSRLFSYVKAAYGLDSDLSAYEFNLAATNSSYASISGLASVLTNFNFQSDGTVADGSTAQTDAEITSTSSKYMSDYSSAHDTLITEAEANYKTKMEAVKTIDDFFASNATDDDSTNNNLPDAYEVALRAYGIDPGEVSKSELKKILESDPYDSTSYVSKLKDDRFTNLAKAFNFDSDGKLRAPVQALSQTTINSYVSKYSAAAVLGLSGATKDKAVSDAKTAATTFATDILSVTSASDFLKNSDLVDFVLKANGIDPKTVDSETLKKAFAADPADSKSFLNTEEGAQFKSIVSAFNFDTDGKLTTTKLGTAQNEGARLTTDDLYLHQTLESQESDSGNEGVHLALYFQRLAPNITSIYDIMSDSALYEVITTTYSLPSSISNMDVSDQADMLSKFVNVADLQDPDKLNHLLQRFSAMYDLANNTTSSPALSILQSSSSGGISADTLLSIAQLQAG